MTKKKKFTVSLWMPLKYNSGEPSGLEMWSIISGEKKECKDQWFSVVSAENEDEALEIGQKRYIKKHAKQDKEA